MDPDTYYFICKKCGLAFETAEAANDPDKHPDSWPDHVEYELVDGSVVDQNLRFIP